MIKRTESKEGTDRLRLFAQIYSAKIEARPSMEIIARYDSMTEAKLELGEREFAENTVDGGKLDMLLHPENYPTQPLKAVA